MEQNREINQNLLKRFAPMDQLSENHLEEVSKKAHIQSYPAKKMLFKRGGQDDYTYFLINGEIDLLDEDFNVTKISSKVEEGKKAVDHRHPFEYSAVTTTPVSVLKINRDHLDLVITWSQAGDYLVEDIDEESSGTQDWMSLLLQSSLLHKIPPSHIQQLFSSFESKRAEKDDVIIKQGEAGEDFFVLESGTAVVTHIKANGEEETLANLTPGDFFGEEALISDTVRNANITMTSSGNLMVLDKASFKRLLKDPVLEFISETELQGLKQKSNKVKILDIRLDSEYQGDEVPDSMHIPFLKLRESMQRLDQSTTYVVHYNGGRRSELAAYLLNEAGLNAIILREDRKRRHA